jgi:PAP2 superfamily
MNRRDVIFQFGRRLQHATLVFGFIKSTSHALGQEVKPTPVDVLRGWYLVMLELVRHTPTYSPPVASRTFAYAGVTAFEAVASGSRYLVSLSGQLNGLATLPQRIAGETYNEALVIHAAMRDVVTALFANTGPTGQRVVSVFGKKQEAKIATGVAEGVVARSLSFGSAVAAHILAWSRDDGGAEISNLGFPLDYTIDKRPGFWVPTSTIAVQQKPLLPEWGKNRTFAMPNGSTCGLPAPPQFSDDKNSAFYAEALEVYETVKNVTPEQRAIARFWSDDAMLSSTPPGHWISIAMQVFERDAVPLEKRVVVLARLGVAVADAFIGCWASKFEYDLLRPVTYIKKEIDPAWETVLITPPFPEYPSGHSTQSGAAAAVLAQAFGENFAFEDETHTKDGIVPRRFESFKSAAEEAALSRLYGGIHFRSAIARGLEQGQCVGAYATALQMTH